MCGSQGSYLAWFRQSTLLPTIKMRLGLVSHGWMRGQMAFPLPLPAYTNLSQQTGAGLGQRYRGDAYLPLQLCRQQAGKFQL